MTFNSFMGIDISKKTLDLCLLSSDNAPDHCTIENNTTAIEHHFTKVINAAARKMRKSCL